jgi:hypothetical protein
VPQFDSGRLRGGLGFRPIAASAIAARPADDATRGRLKGEVEHKGERYEPRDRHTLNPPVSAEHTGNRQADDGNTEQRQGQVHCAFGSRPGFCRGFWAFHSSISPMRPSIDHRVSATPAASAGLIVSVRCIFTKAYQTV